MFRKIWRLNKILHFVENVGFKRRILSNVVEIVIGKRRDRDYQAQLWLAYIAAKSEKHGCV